VRPDPAKPLVDGDQKSGGNSMTGMAFHRIGEDVNGNELHAFTVGGKVAGIVMSTGESCELLAGWGDVGSSLRQRWNSLEEAKADINDSYLKAHFRAEQDRKASLQDGEIG
jgi:hypothetical protein